MDKTDQEILTTLQGVQFGQEAVLTRAKCGGDHMEVWMSYLAGHYRDLPSEVAHRLTAINSGAITTLDRQGVPRGAALAEVIAKVASPAAMAQVMRAVNVYRERVGRPPLGT